MTRKPSPRLLAEDTRARAVAERRERLSRDRSTHLLRGGLNRDTSPFCPRVVTHEHSHTRVMTRQSRDRVRTRAHASRTSHDSSIGGQGPRDSTRDRVTSCRRITRVSRRSSAPSARCAPREGRRITPSTSRKSSEVTAGRRDAHSRRMGEGRRWTLRHTGRDGCDAMKTRRRRDRERARAGTMEEG